MILHRFTPGSDASAPRRGAFMILAACCLVLTIGFVSLSVDLGMVSLTRTRMQTAVDAAALAAAMEITHAVETAPADETNITAYARTAAARKAAEIAQLNGVYVDPSRDVEFGRRVYNETSKQFVIDWNVGAQDPVNVVRVASRKENSDLTQPDAKLRLFFAGFFGDNTARLRTEAVAYVEARDLVVVHDFSRSMNFDSYFSDEAAATLSDPEILANLQSVWEDLQPLNLGKLGFQPQWLTLTQSNPAMSVTFKYHIADVVSEKTLKRVKLQFTDGKENSFNVSVTSGSYQGIGANKGKDISKVWLTWEETANVPVTLTGQAASGCIPQITVAFSADRKSVSVVSTKDLSNVVLLFDDNVAYKFDNLNQGKIGTFQGVGANAGKKIKTVWVKSGCNASNDGPGYGERFDHPNPSDKPVEVTREFADTNLAVMTTFGLVAVPYPYPSGTWDEYINFVRTNGPLYQKGYREMYGGLTFVQFLLRAKSSHAQTPALARTRHYPFHSIKLGHSLLCNFLENLGFQDYLGMVSYDTYHRIETFQQGVDVPFVDISAKPLSTAYQAVNELMRSKQANHYYPATNIGGGMRDAISLLESYGRPGARPNILLMTDGNANVTDGPTTLPAGWERWFDGYDGPGSTYNIQFDNPSSSVLKARQQLLYEVHRAVQKGYTIHTIAVGADGDWRTLKAIAHYAKGQFIHVPGGTSVEEMEAGLLNGFHRIAGLVPPARLMAP